MWYCHRLSTVLVVWGQVRRRRRRRRRRRPAPTYPQPSQDEHLHKYAVDKATGELVPTDEPNPRDGRGWPTYEFAVTQVRRL